MDIAGVSQNATLGRPSAITHRAAGHSATLTDFQYASGV